MRGLTIAIVILVLSSPLLHALTAEEAIRLSRAGVSDDVLLSQIEADGSAGTVPSADAERMRRAYVSETIIRALAGDTAARREASEPVELRPGEALLAVRNEDRRPVSIVIDPAAGGIEFAQAGKGAGSLAPGQVRETALRAGVWTAIWRGEPKTYRVSIRPAERTDLILLAIDAPDAEGTRLRVLRNGRDFGSTVLRLAPKLVALPVERPPRTVVLQAAPRTVVIERQTVYAQPGTVYVPACAPDPYGYDSHTIYAPAPAPAGYVYPHEYGVWSATLPDWHHGGYPPTYYGTPYGNGCGR